MIRVKLAQKVGGWSIITRGHADEHVCLAASVLFNAIGVSFELLAKAYPDQIQVTFDDKTPKETHSRVLDSSNSTEDG